MKKIIGYTFCLSGLLCIGFIKFDSKGKSSDDLDKAAASKTVALVKTSDDDVCGEWQKDASSDFQFRNCHFTDDENFRTYQVYNPYDFQVHVTLTLDFTNGTSNRVGMYIDANKPSDKASTNHRKISDWQITKKQRQNSDGNWVDF